MPSLVARLFPRVQCAFTRKALPLNPCRAPFESRLRPASGPGQLVRPTDSGAPCDPATSSPGGVTVSGTGASKGRRIEGSKDSTPGSTGTLSTIGTSPFIQSMVQSDCSFCYNTWNTKYMHIFRHFCEVPCFVKHVWLACSYTFPVACVQVSMCFLVISSSNAGPAC